MTLHLPDTSNQDNRSLSHRYPLDQHMSAGCYTTGVTPHEEERMRREDERRVIEPRHTAENTRN